MLVDIYLIMEEIGRGVNSSAEEENVYHMEW